MDWKIEYFSDAVQRDILTLPAGLLARYIHLTDRMIGFGPNLGMPHTRFIDKGLFELRLKAAEGIARVFFFARTGQRIVMLHQFVKNVGKNTVEGDQDCNTQNEGDAKCLVTAPSGHGH